jgi:hypothetical protein
MDLKYFPLMLVGLVVFSSLLIAFVSLGLNLIKRLCRNQKQDDLEVGKFGNSERVSTEQVSPNKIKICNHTNRQRNAKNLKEIIRSPSSSKSPTKTTSTSLPPFVKLLEPTAQTFTRDIPTETTTKNQTPSRIRHYREISPLVFPTELNVSESSSHEPTKPVKQKFKKFASYQEAYEAAKAVGGGLEPVHHPPHDLTKRNFLPHFHPHEHMTIREGEDDVNYHIAYPRDFDIYPLDSL